MSRHETRSRKFSVVIHDVVPTAKEIVSAYAQRLCPKYYMVALEEYNHQEGHHIHLFMELVHPRSKFAVLKDLQQLFTGRVQVDHGRGSRDQCIAYLTDPSKSKKVDTNITLQDGVPKIRYHTHSTIVKSYAPRCPRCAWLKYLNKLKTDDALAEHRKPYIMTPPPGILQDELKYYM